MTVVEVILQFPGMLFELRKTRRQPQHFHWTFRMLQQTGEKKQNKNKMADAAPKHCSSAVLRPTFWCNLDTWSETHPSACQGSHTKPTRLCDPGEVIRLQTCVQVAHYDSSTRTNEKSFQLLPRFLQGVCTFTMNSTNRLRAQSAGFEGDSMQHACVLTTTCVHYDLSLPAWRFLLYSLHPQ